MAPRAPAGTEVAPRAWLVVDGHGREALFLDRARAEQAAADHHGTLEALLTEGDVRRMIDAAYRAGEAAARAAADSEAPGERAYRRAWRAGSATSSDDQRTTGDASEPLGDATVSPARTA